ncbi:MAG: MaoC family dehydratase [Desulfobacula sp.]|jgi:3-hydroxybutyryl-CoA dehydratase|uniref:MaoC family dehydratase n=1 Tax=Desulfobacula sp. TaxID=2593537 RepID=UPI001DD4DB00|nr:MaoC family dehydratase [Desulfobacula sp.]MBT3484887.1 MaoC family dehydratase [Desulfobacula sp.]MBT3804643.1 MaoC family dehydratase [Desulfobacula sp.]MBT4023993.1 MaoC family dehydratase [Desulfobacula sp.]MBT4198355.1 MaoC family dehydratase [Desulfobacula sp.]
MNYKLTAFGDLKVGQKAYLKKTITQEDLTHFIVITDDKNPLHIDESFAEKTFFGQRIAHGMLSASLFSTLVGMHIPGTGAIYKSQTLEFLRPVFIGDTLYAWFEIIDIDPDSEEIVIKSWIENQDGKNVIEGKTVASLLRGLKK